MKAYGSIDEYIAAASDNLQPLLETIRQTIQAAAPEAKQKISYGIPTFTFQGNLVHFGGFKDHIGFFPGSGPIVEFEKELKNYQTSKGTVRLPLDQPLPLDLITRMTKAAIKRNLERGKK